VGLQVEGRSSFGREPGLKLIGHRPGDFALNRKDIGEIAIVDRAQRCASVERRSLGIDPDRSLVALDAAFDYMRDAECRRSRANAGARVRYCITLVRLIT